jgi:hypothetical protein
MSLVIEGLRADVESVAGLGDEMVGEVAERIGALLVRSAPSRILELLSDIAAELSEELPDGRVEIRVMGDEVELAYVDEPRPSPEGDSELSARITLRLPERLKARVEDAATSQSISVNTWILRALERGVSSTPSRNSRGGKRLQGYATS